MGPERIQNVVFSENSSTMAACSTLHASHIAWIAHFLWKICIQSRYWFLHNFFSSVEFDHGSAWNPHSLCHNGFLLLWSRCSALCFKKNIKNWRWEWKWQKECKNEKNRKFEKGVILPHHLFSIFFKSMVDWFWLCQQPSMDFINSTQSLHYSV